MAKKLNVSQNAISLYESNKRSLTPESLQKIADILGKNISYFYELDANEDIKDKEQREIYDIVMSLANGDKQFALGCLRMLKEGRGKHLKPMEDLYREVMGTLKLTRENELLIRKMLMLVKVQGQDKLEAILKLLK